jgi:phosphocarrier protein HPr
LSAIRRDFLISNTLGLHARAAATLVKTTSRFRCEVNLGRVGQAPVNAKSILGVMTLAAAKGTAVTVSCEGPDQEEALAAIGQVIDNRFGEE